MPMKSRLPTEKEIAELLSFLPKLTADGFEPFRGWHGGPTEDGEAMAMPSPAYDKSVEEFFRVASRACWSDYEYRPAVAGRMLTDPDEVRAADLAGIRTMLTYCVRGERFGAGHWGAMIQGGHVERLLRRLAEIERGND